ncbi:Tox-REase-5 domain-containing protein [Streptomyces sp. NPDC058231]|uniref:Tox-REase-5 domain-containing protein n=1 Tax=Streptomyces sp. NPDC058231 TaxID=3346392 RepID=UPI0036E75A4A
MSGIGGIAVPGGADGGAFLARSGRQSLPRPLQAVLILVRVLFAFAVLGGAGVLTLASSLNAVDGQLFGLLLYAALPSVTAFVLALYVRTGGIWIRRGLLAVHVWLTLGALATLGSGDGRGAAQLVIPVVIVVLLFRPSAREWFELPPEQRQPHRPFSIARMIKWRRDGGQTAMEYLGLILVVVALVGALVATGIGAQLTGEMRSAICQLTGSACPAPGGGDVVAGNGADGGTTASGGGTDSGGAVAGGGTDSGGAVAGGGTDSGGSDTGGADASGGTGGTGGANGSGGTGGTDTATQDGDGDVDEGGDDMDPTQGPDADYGNYDGTQKDESCTSGIGAFFSCAGHQTGGFFKGLVGDGLWGDVTGTFDTVIHPVKAWNGLMDYGKSLGDKWVQDSKGAGDKWSKGDYFGAAWDWTKASGGTGLKVLDDMFIGDDVRDMWKKGDEGQAIGTGLWNIGSLFIPGYGEAKLVGKFGKLGKLGKLGKVGELAEKASEAASKAKKLAKAGDVGGAEKAAEEARRHADDLEKKVESKGCPIGAGPLGRPAATTVVTASVRTAAPGVAHATYAGRTTTATATGTATVTFPVVRAGFRTEGCEATPEEVEAAKQAKKDADQADEAAKAAKREAERKRLAKMEKPSWYDTLKNPRAGTKDLGDGKWKSKGADTYAYPQEMGARYQEQISGVKRGKEYEVPLDTLDGKPVEFDGWDSANQTYLETKWGYRGPRFYDEATGQLTNLATNRWVQQATRQLDAARGKPVVWHMSDPDVARAAQDMFDDRGLDITVVHTPVKP